MPNRSWKRRAWSGDSGAVIAAHEAQRREVVIDVVVAQHRHRRRRQHRGADAEAADQRGELAGVEARP